MLIANPVAHRSTTSAVCYELDINILFFLYHLFPKQEDCQWTILAPEGYTIRLMFNTFDIEHETECDYDYLEILDGNEYSSPVIGRYCGHQVSEKKREQMTRK